jgi:anti-anti-sigma factor
MKECPFCHSEIPDVAHYCSNCGKSTNIGEAAEAVAKAESGTGAVIETRYVPGHAGIAILKIVGNCDGNQVQKLNMELSVLRNDNPDIVIFDLSGTDSICSMALSTIIAFVSDREDDKENSTALVNVRENVRQVIDCLGIGAMLPVYNSIKTALEELRAK